MTHFHYRGETYVEKEILEELWDTEWSLNPANFANYTKINILLFYRLPWNFITPASIEY